MSRVSACSIGLTRPGSPAVAVEASALAIGWLAESCPVRTVEIVNGLPQSMQKREFGSFSFPQKLQVPGELTRGGSRACEANIGWALVPGLGGAWWEVGSGR